MGIGVIQMELIMVILRHITIFIDRIVEIMTKLIVLPSEFVKNKIGELTKIIDNFQQEKPSMFIFLTTSFICLVYIGIVCMFTLEFGKEENSNGKKI